VTENPPGEARTLAGRYRILNELGRGGMGVVWLATDELLGRQVAVKEIRPPFGAPADQRRSFTKRALREARTAGRLNHPAVVTVHDVVPATADDEAIYIVMELIRAPDLAEVIETGGPLPETRAIALAAQLLDALHATHSIGVVHRDIKPANILILPGDRVKLADFGIAHATDDTRLTASGVIGAAAYMAPELFHGAEPSPACDLWSLGATLYHATHGNGPFDRATTAATLHAILSDPPPPPRCDPPLSTLITALLARDPADRATIERAHQILDRPLPRSPALAPDAPSDDPPQLPNIGQHTPPADVTFGQTTHLGKPRPKDRPAVKSQAADEKFSQKTTTKTTQHELGKDKKPSDPWALLIGLVVIVSVIAAIPLLAHNGHHDKPQDTPASRGTNAGEPRSDAPSAPEVSSSATERDPFDLDDESTDDTPFTSAQLFPRTVSTASHDYPLVSSDVYSTCENIGGAASRKLVAHNDCDRMATGVYRNTHTGLFASVDILRLATHGDASKVNADLRHWQSSAAFNALSVACPGSGPGSRACDSRRPGTRVGVIAFHRYEIIVQMASIDGSDVSDRSRTTTDPVIDAATHSIEDSIQN
jgi:serine/threonine protein kinase